MKKLILPIALFFLLAAIWPTAWAENQPSIKIQVQGISDPLKGKIMNMLAGRSQALPTPLTEESIKRFYKESTTYVRTGLEPYGYFEPQISTNLYHSGNTWTMTYSINTGPVIRITHVDLKISGGGAADPAFIALYQTIPVKVGQSLNVDNYQKAKDALFNLAADRGYFSAKMSLSQIVINKNNRQASIILHFDTGPRYRFGETLFPPSDLNSKFLQKFLRYKQGDYYSSELVQKTQQVLAGSGYFTQTIVTPLPNQAQNYQVPIKIELTPVKPQTYTFGLGYGTDTGPRGTLGFNWIPVNSYGHHINVLARGSYINVKGSARQNNNINASYIIPGSDPATDFYTINTGYGNIVQETGKANSFKTSISYSTRFDRSWQEVLALTYLDENYQLPGTPYILANVLYPNGHWQYTYNLSSHQQIVDNGISGSFDVAGATKAVISKTDFLQGKLGIKALGTFDPTNTRFLFHGAVGQTVVGKNELDNIPLTLQLFAGGPTTIRGYKYNSIGPGRNLVIASGEIQQKVYSNWYIAGFLDSGAVSGSDASINNNFNGRYLFGAGAGAVLLTPIGSVEVSLARPVFDPRNGKTWQLEFSVGTEL
ncbi:MAG: BamA/TamA family outer membrane protein [Proteobacteria bacterium]|nr:BamA/TamA family outer membrane protein [Pseudomonadota bacterium]